MGTELERLLKRLEPYRGRIVDMHIHPTTNSAHWEAMVAQARRAGVSRFVLSNVGIPNVPLSATPEQIRAQNEFSHSLRQKHPGFVDMYVYLDFQEPECAVEEIEYWVGGRGAVGIKIEWALGGDGSLDVTRAALATAARYGVPVKIHTFYRSGGSAAREATPTHIAQLAVEIPDATIIMAHFGGDWVKAAQTVRHLPNVCGDTSGCTWRSGFTEFVVNELGAERVLYGSDMPCRSFGPQIAKVLFANIRDVEKELIFYRNSDRLFPHRPLIAPDGEADGD